MSGVLDRIGRRPGIRRRMGKSSAEERFTLLLVSSRGRSRSVGFSLKSLKVLGWLGVVMITALIGLVTAYRINRRELVQLRYLREVAESQKEQIRSLQDQFSAISERLREAELLEAHIREMLDKEGILPQAFASGGTPLMTTSRTGPVLTSRDGYLSRLMGPEDMSRALRSLTAATGLLEERTLERQRNAEALRDRAEETVAVLRATPSVWPVIGEISSEFGWRLNPFNYYSREYHSGVDIAALWWEPIAATADGTVTFSGYKYGYGWMVIIEHGYGFETLYAHCCRLEVDWGDRVSRGDVIAYVGQSGTATGPHLHYEVHLWGTALDPEGYLP